MTSRFGTRFGGNPEVLEQSVLADDEPLLYGTGEHAAQLWDTTDPNANALYLSLPSGDSVNVPVLAVGIGIRAVDLGMFDGLTETFLGIIDADRDSHVGFHYSGDDAAVIRMRLGAAGTVRSHTIPDVASSTLAVLGAAQTWTGTQTFGATILMSDAAGPAIANEAATTTNPTLIPNRAELDTGIGWAVDTIHIVLGGANEISITTTALSPGTSDGNALGTGSLMWADLFLASASVINWNNGDVTLTHAAGKLTFGGDGAVELDFNNHEMTNVDINSGAIDGAAIGAASATTIVGTTIDATTDFTIGATVITDGVLTDAGGFQIAAALDMDSNTISNIGASGFNLTGSGLVDVAGVSGNIWSSTVIDHKGSGISSLERTTASTNNTGRALTLQRTSSNNMTDGFGVLLGFEIEDTGASDQLIGLLGFERAGADNTGDFILTTYVAGTGNDAFKVDSGGLGSFDLAGAGDAVPTLFDDYDDAMVLQRGISLGNRDELDRMGVIGRKNTGSGWWVNIQPFIYLLAGGVYQNRERMDMQFDELNRRLVAIGA